MSTTRNHVALPTTLPLKQRVIAVLQEARNILSVPGAWTQETFARDVEGKSARPREVSAVCFCAKGALDLACKRVDEGAFSTAVLLLAKAAPRNKGCPVAAFNDAPGRTQAEVVALFDKAIAATKAKARVR